MKKLFGAFEKNKSGALCKKPAMTVIAERKPRANTEFTWMPCDIKYADPSEFSQKTGINLNSIKNDFHYAIDYDVKFSDCTQNCDCLCRCKTITDTTIKDPICGFLSTIQNRIKVKNYKYCKKLNKFKSNAAIDFVPDNPNMNYILDRLAVIHQAYDQENYDIGIRGGYYGEEVYNITFSNFTKFLADFKKAMLLDTHECILFLLELEYDVENAMLEKCVEAGHKFNRVYVPISKLKVGNENYSYTLLRKKENIKRSLDPDIPIGVYISDGGFYRVIDGYHRFHSISTDTVSIFSIEKGD